MIERIELSGTPYEMGVQHGKKLKDEVRELARLRLTLAQQFASEHGVRPTEEECREMARLHLPLHEQYSPRSIDEWRGIAEGADIAIEDVFFANALTDFQDVLWQTSGVEVHGCTSFAVGPEATEGRATYIGQTWDMHASAEPFVRIFHRQPTDGPESLTMSTAGCLSLVGVNQEGIAVGNNNLRPRDARPGVIYLAMLHEALHQTQWNDAVACITEAPRASGHNYIMCHEFGARANIETTATQYDTHLVSGNWYVHTNHYLSPRLVPLEDPTNEPASTEHRLERGRHAFQQAEQPFTPDAIRELMSDHDGGDLGICRHGTGDDARSVAFVVADPKRRSLWVSLGPPCEGSLQEYSLTKEKA